MKTLWRVSKHPTPVERSSLPSEKLLEEMLISNLRILSPDWMLLGNQVSTGTGFIDILAVSRDGTLVVVELKRERATRDVVAQTLDYVSWVATLPSESVSELFQQHRGTDLGAAFTNHFGTSLDVEQLNGRQMGVIVASTPDQTTERIVKYLANSGTPINLNTFGTVTTTAPSDTRTTAETGKTHASTDSSPQAEAPGTRAHSACSILMTSSGCNHPNTATSESDASSRHTNR